VGLLLMHPYWVKFEHVSRPSIFNSGMGVTARSEIDAREIVVAAIGDEPRITSVVVIENMASLDQGHVIPNMGNIFIRGIWFPLGYPPPEG
jgi:hypothetical protein